MTKAEKRWMDAICRLGCIVCYLLGFPGSQCVPHHLLTKGGRRRGHLFTIPLCDPGHHQYGAPLKISRHPWWTRFEDAYGTEDYLLERTQQLVAELNP